MPRQKPADQIDTLRRQQAEITAKLKEAETKAREKKRVDDQRREVLAGRCMLHHIDQDADCETGKALLALLDGFLTKAADRTLFPVLTIVRETEPTP